MSAQLRPVAEPRGVHAVRLGFLGLGWIGRARLDAIATFDEVEVAALADCDSGKLQSAATAHPHARAVATLDALLEVGLDGVVIATPNAFHAPQALVCLPRGASVYCQKPLTTTTQDTRAVIAAAQRADRLLGVDFCYRRVAGMDELRRRIAAGELGEILSLDLVFHNAYGPDKAWARDAALAGGGALLDLGVHLLDLALWLLPTQQLRLVSSRLYRNGARAHGRLLDDMALAELEDENGGTVRLACSWNAHAGRDAVIGFELLGTRGGAAWRNVAGSFYDFTLDVFEGRSSERIAAPPDAWGARALRCWVERLRDDARFDAAEARRILASAQLIDEIYGS